MVSKTTFNYKKTSQMFPVNVSTERIFTASNNLATRTPPNSHVIRTHNSSSVNSVSIRHSESITICPIILSSLYKKTLNKVYTLRLAQIS